MHQAFVACEFNPRVATAMCLFIKYLCKYCLGARQQLLSSHQSRNKIGGGEA